MKSKASFRNSGQTILLIIALVCFIAGHFVNETADALLDAGFAACIFGMILLEIVCRKRRPGKPVWTRRAKRNIFFAFLYLLIFVVHAALVIAQVQLPGPVRTIMSLIGAVSLIALLVHDMKADRRRKNK